MNASNPEVHADLRTFAIHAYPVEKVPELRPGMSAYTDWRVR